MTIFATFRRSTTPGTRGGLPDMDHVQLPSYGLIFFNHLVGEFDSLDCKQPVVTPAPDAHDSGRDEDCRQIAYERAKALRAEYKNGSDKLTWGDLYAFERDLIELTPGRALRERLWSVEKRYLDIGTSADYTEHVKAIPLDVEKADEADIRA